MKPAPISQEQQKAVNWLDIEQQLFYNNCPPYLHPVPVPAVYNGSMYPKRLYPDEPGATKFKRLFFPSSGITQKKRNLFSLQRGITKKKQPSLSHSAPVLEHRKDSTGTSGRREATSFMISLLKKIFGAAGWLSLTAFQELPAGMPMQRSHALHRDICALSHTHKASELTAGKVLPQQQNK